MALKLVEQRTPTWASFTTLFPEGVTARAAVEGANMEELIIKAPLYADLGEGPEPIEGKYGMIIPRTNKWMGVASESYDFLQNMELADLLDRTLTRQFPVVAAGNTPDGAGVVFVLDMGMRPVAGEQVRTYFVIAEARAVGVALKWALTPVRFECLNTLMTAFRRATMLMSARHDKNFRSNVEGGAAYVLQAQNEAERQMQVFDQMARARITQAQFLEFVRHLYPYPDRSGLDALEQSFLGVQDEYTNAKLLAARRAVTYATSQADQFREITTERFVDFPTQNADLRWTAWAAYNAAVEVQDFALAPASIAKAVLSDALLGRRADVKTKALVAATNLAFGRLVQAALPSGAR